MPRVQRGKVSATFEAREAAGCGSLRLLCALRGTRILQAAAPTAPPCFGRWPRSLPLQTRGCSPLVTPKQLGSIQKIQVAPLKDFLCCADFKAPQSLCDSSPKGERARRQRRAFAESGAANAVCRYDPSGENAFGALRRARQTRNLKYSFR